MNDSRLEPFFLDGSAGRIFLLLRAPANASRCVLFVPAFAEEMNKSRCQVTDTAKALIESGYAVLLVDLYGTGDSQGEFSDATWDIWRENIEEAMIWAEQAGFMPDSIVGTRLGCALAAESLKQFDRSVARTVFWQAIEVGRQYMNQFLRLRVAATMMQADDRESAESLKKQLSAGESLDVAGYRLSPTLFSAIEALNLNHALDPCLGELCLLEVGPTQDGALSIPGQRLLSSAESKGISVLGRRISGAPFWNATEIVVNPDLSELTARYLVEGRL